MPFYKTPSATQEKFQQSDLCLTLCAMCHAFSLWRKCMGIEPTTDIVCPPQDLKSRRPTRTCPLPFKRLIDRPFKVEKFLQSHRRDSVRRHWTGHRDCQNYLSSCFRISDRIQTCSRGPFCSSFSGESATILRAWSRPHLEEKTGNSNRTGVQVPLVIARR